MLFALLLLSAAANWVPMRWSTADPASVTVLKDSPINCLLLEKDARSKEMAAAAASIGADALSVVDPPTEEAVRQAAAAKMKGVVYEGQIPAGVRKSAEALGLIVVELPARAHMRFEPGRPIAGTFQGVWPGIRAVDENDAAHAAPSGAPWIDTNSGFLRFVRAATDAPVWMGVRPPVGAVITPERYLQAISDAAIVGARWIVTLDHDFTNKLVAGDASTRKAWSQMAELLRYFEAHPQWRSMGPAGQLAILQDVNSGALLSGGVLDMIAVKHTPIRPIPTRNLSAETMAGAKMAVNVAPDSMTDAQKEALVKWRRSGNTLLSGPATWKFPEPKVDQITLGEEDVKTLDQIWKELNAMTGRRNLGARLFNVSSMLSNLIQSTDGKQHVLHLVNYSGYPVENVTVHVLGRFTSATLLSPGAEPRKLEVYEVDEGSGIDVDEVNIAASLILE